jgi:UDP-N-acetylglucosamine--N-acetylmuramyl-(pentapeptide) pyrophosphoryl-undecaprenol N-acetylglucosamine transferase
MSQKIALVGGGTGGHIVPLLSLIEHLPIPKADFFWIGGSASMEQIKAQEANIRFIPITTFKLTSTKSLGVFLYPFKLLQGIWDAIKVLKNEQPKLVFSKGGPGSIAVGIAAWSLGIPLYIHESDTVPGFSNKVLGHFATQIFLGFEEAGKYFPANKTTVIGQILHPQFFEKNPTGNINWKTSKKHIFVSCGSQ